MEPKIGDLVWAKMKGFSPWPARVVKPGPNAKKTNKKNSSWIYFFGTNDYAWIENSHIKPYEAFKEKLSQQSKTALFKEAVRDIENFIVKKGEDANYEATFDKLLQSEEELNESNVEEKESPSQPPPKKAKKQSIGATKRWSSDDTKNSTTPSKSRRESTPKFDENGTSEKAYDEEISDFPPNIDQPESPEIDLNKISDEMKNKNITPSKLTFGFMGLGNMGSSLVKNLINSGHRVNLWNRTYEKCEKIKTQADANQLGLVQAYQTPCDVVQNSDIIFSCLSDARVAKEIVIGNCGVIHQADGPKSLEGKGYVEMTSIDVETSKDISNIIESKGGRYLEAQMQGSKKQAEDSTLIILTSGSKRLFVECQSCFKAIGATAYFLGPVGSAIKMNLCINMTLGISLTGFAEAMILAERCGLSCKDFLEIFKLSEGASNYVANKGNIMINRDYCKVEQALEYMQKDIKLCLDMSHDIKQNLPVAAAANEVYKTARRFGYDGHDVSVVFKKIKH